MYNIYPWFKAKKKLSLDTNTEQEFLELRRNHQFQPLKTCQFSNCSHLIYIETTTTSETYLEQRIFFFFYVKDFKSYKIICKIYKLQNIWFSKKCDLYLLTSLLIQQLTYLRTNRFINLHVLKKILYLLATPASWRCPSPPRRRWCRRAGRMAAARQI